MNTPLRNVAPLQDGTPPDRLGPYQVLGPLGRGGMGEVLLAHDSRLDRRVAIKRIRTDLSSPSARERFQREAKLAATFSHAAIVQVYDLLELDGTQHIVMEYVTGSSLRQRLELEGPPPVDVGLQIAHHLASGIADAHTWGIVHRDLKTENVLLTSSGIAKITDFGIACRLPEEGTPSASSRTSEGTMLGTHRAMSPEQVCGDPIDTRTDLFSFGVLLYELFTGHSPFNARTRQETIRRVIVHQPPAIDVLSPTLSPALGELVTELLAKEPDQRPQTMDQVVERLERIASMGGNVETRLTGISQDVSQGTLPTWLQGDSRLAPVLTILAHPEVERVGMRTPVDELLLGDRVLISRLHPRFGPPRSPDGLQTQRRPLFESHLSRQPIILRCRRRTGTLLIDRAGSRTSLSVDGQRVEDHIELDVQVLRQGVVLILSRRITLLLHFLDPSRPVPQLDDPPDTPIAMPDDIARLFFGTLLQGSKGPRPHPSADGIARLVRSRWPGHLGQLRDVVRQWVALGPEASDGDLDELLKHPPLDV